MKLVKEIERKYYKYQYSSWTQPILSSNGEMGSDSFACAGDGSASDIYAAWKVFNGNTTFANNNCYVSNNASNGFIEWYNPVPLKITNLQIMNYSVNEVIKDYTVQGSNDNINWIDITTGTNTNKSQQGVWDINISNNQTAYNYYRIFVTSAYSNDWQICLITITATTRTIVEGTASDYDFYEDVDVYKAVKIDDDYYGVNQ